MKVSIKTRSRPDELLKGQIRVVKKVYADEKPALEPRRPRLKAQKEMLDYWNTKWEQMIKEIKKEISEVISAVR